MGLIGRSLALSALLSAASLGGWAFWLEPASLFNQDHTIDVPHWPPECDGLRVAVLADLHVGSPHNQLDKLERVIDLTLRARPDLVLIAGDLVIHGVLGGTFTPPETIAARLGRLQAKLGVYSVLGNHDWWFDGPRVRRALEDHGIPVLDNRAERVADDRCAFWLAGIGDLWEGTPEIETTLASVPEDASVLAFTHNPDLFPAMPSRVALTIAGHTHGGQVHLPLLGRPIVPSRYGERFAIGHVVEGGRHLFVSSGLGTSILPVRFRVPPEVSVVTLQSARAGAI